MRLIDADELLFVLERYSEIIVPSEAGVQAVNLQTIQHLVADMPTAYDIDKVVEQLAYIHDNAIKVISSRLVQFTGYADGYADGVIKAIEIVKGGAE